MVDMDVVIPTFGRPATANATLRMLLAQEPLPARVIVVNQTPGVTSAEPDVVEAYRKAELELIWINRAEPSLCGARNDALRAARGEFCLFLDDDIVIPAGLVGKHREKYRKEPSWHAVGGQVWHRLPHVAADATSLEEPDRGTTPALVEAAPVPDGPLFGGHFSVRRSTALLVGGWDEAFVGSANWEEGDIMHRLRKEGFPFVWDPNLWLIHLRLPAGGCRIPGNRSFPEWTKTVNFFLYKYRYPQEKSWTEVIRSALRAGPLRREIVIAPGRWPWAWLAFAKGWIVGRKKAAHPVLPFLKVSRGSQ